MTHHALINVKPPKQPPHTLAFPQPVPGSVLCQLEVLSVHQVILQHTTMLRFPSYISCEMAPPSDLIYGQAWHASCMMRSSADVPGQLAAAWQVAQRPLDRCAEHFRRGCLTGSKCVGGADKGAGSSLAAASLGGSACAADWPYAPGEPAGSCLRSSLG